MSPSPEVGELIEKFWESIPPAWRETRETIRRIAVEQFDMTVGQFQVLRRIRKGVDTVSGLAEANRTSRPAVSKAVEALVQKGLVARLPDAHDRRQIRLVLTQEGNRLLAAIYDQAEAWLAERFEPLSSAERTALLAAMDSLRRTFEETRS